jgi:myosin heavy chain 6/7
LKIRELDAELESEQKAHQEVLKELRKSERRLKAMSVRADEEHRAHTRLQQLVERLQSKREVSRREQQELEASVGELRRAQVAQVALEERASEAATQVGTWRAKSRCGASVAASGRSLASVYGRASSVSYLLS